MKYNFWFIELSRCILLSTIFIAIFSQSDIIAQSKQEKTFFVRPPTVDPSYNMAVTAPLHRFEPTAKWIWTLRTSDAQVIYVRKTFNLKMLPHSATLYITADNRFVVWVNEHRIGATPDSTDDLVWTNVQHFNIGTYLTKGRNVISIQGENQGGAAGILAMLKVNGSVFLSTDESWKVLDQATPPDLWNTIALDDSSWKNVTIIAPYGSGVWGSKLIDWPGEEADEGYLKHISIPPKKVTILFGKNQITGAETLASHKIGQAIISPDSESDSTRRVLQFDFGQELAGRLQVCGTQGIHVIVSTGESLQECNHQEPALDNHGPFSLTLNGIQPASTPYTAFRYATLQYNGSMPLHITQVRCDFKYYPVQYSGSFNCSDHSLLGFGIQVRIQLISVCKKISGMPQNAIEVSGSETCRLPDRQSTSHLAIGF
jgi:hypothetical protein